MPFQSNRFQSPKSISFFKKNNHQHYISVLAHFRLLYDVTGALQSADYSNNVTKHHFGLPELNDLQSNNVNKENVSVGKC